MGYKREHFPSNQKLSYVWNHNSKFKMSHFTWFGKSENTQSFPTFSCQEGVSSLNHHYSSLCRMRNTESNEVTLEAELQLEVKLFQGDKLNERIINQLDSCEGKALCRNLNKASKSEPFSIYIYLYIVCNSNIKYLSHYSFIEGLNTVA